MRRIFLHEFVRKPLFLIFVFMYIVMDLALFFFLRAEMTGFYLLYVLSRFAFYIDAVFMVGVFLACSSSHHSHMDEVISACRGRGFYQRRIAGGAFLIAGICQLTVLAALFAASYANDGTAYFFNYFLKSYLYNLLFPMIICLMVAWLLSRWQHRMGASIVLAVFTILISPIFFQLTWESQPAVPIDQWVRMLLRPFRIFYENGNIAPNSQLGLQTNASRGSLLLFWFLLLTGLLMVSCAKKKRRRKWAAAVLWTGSFCALLYACLPSGDYRISLNWDGTWEDYDTYYYQPVGLEEDTETYRVAEYDLQLDFDRMMTVDAKLQLEADEAQEQFVLTLYHGYDITELSSADASVTWQADGDYVTIETDTPVTELTIEMTYRGSHDIFYSYGEGAMLPGWFAWYPMGGEKQVMLNYETVPSGYNTFNRIEDARISLHADGDFEMVCNLEETGENTFSGVADSITLIGGAILLTEDEQVKDYLPLDLTVDETAYMTSLSEQWQTVCDEWESYGMDLPFERSCPILLASRDLCRFYSLNGLALFEDYILTWSDGLTIQNVSQQMILGKNASSHLANMVCSMGGLYASPEDTLARWLEYQPEAEENGVAEQMNQVLILADSAGRGEEAVRKIAQFLCTEDAAANEQAFLEGLCEEYASD